MINDELKAQWQAQDPGPLISVPAEVLIRELRRSERLFDAMVLWRDVREIVVAMSLVALFIWWAILGFGWPTIVLAAGCLWIAAFFVIDRLRTRDPAADPAQSVRACTERSLRRIEHQIWLLRNVFRWYLLPGIPGYVLFGVYWAWRVRLFPWTSLRFLLGYLVVGALVYGVVYRLNQRTVREELEPRRAELRAILESLREPTA